MAEGIRLWIREIVIVLLLAGTLEMLIPETGMKRFARVAVGFFVVLAVAKPILGLLGGGVLFDKSLAGIGSWELGLRVSESGGAAGAADPLGQGAALRQASRDRALVATRAGLESQVAALALRETGVARAAAEVDLVSDPSSTSYGSLQAVRLRVWLTAVDGTGDPSGSTGGPSGSSGTTGGAGGATGPPVTPVSPVTVTVSPVLITGASSEASDEGTDAVVDDGGTPGSTATGAAGEMATRLRSQLVLLFGVPPGGITVEVYP